MPTGKNRVPMATLREALTGAGFKNVHTYIANGNVVADSPLAEAAVARKVHTLIMLHIGPNLGVVVRSRAQLTTVLKRNPFPEGKPNRMLVAFFADPIPHDLQNGISTTGKEEVVEKREVYIHYPDGVGHSSLSLPEAAKEGTARTVNTIARLVEMAQERICNRGHAYAAVGPQYAGRDASIKHHDNILPNQ